MLCELDLLTAWSMLNGRFQTQLGLGYCLWQESIWSPRQKSIFPTALSLGSLAHIDANIFLLSVGIA